MIRKIINFILFDFAWFACVFSGVHNTPLIAVAVVLVVLTYNFMMRKEHFLSDLKLILTVSAIGFCLDSFNLLIDVFNLHGSPRFVYLCPLWLFMLWMAFSTILRNSLSWLEGRYWLGCLLGAFSGSTSYLAGARMGAVNVNSWGFATVVIAIEWALVMPLFIWLAHGSSKKHINASAETEDHQ